MSRNNETPRSPMGARLGERIAGIVTRSVVDARERLARQTHDIGLNVVTQFTNHVSDEVRSALGPTFRRLADDPATAPEIRPLLSHLGRSQGQAWAWIGGTAAGAAMGAGLMDLLSNWTTEPIGALIAQNPRGGLSPEQAAALRGRNIPTAMDLKHEAARRGINADRLEALERLSMRGLTEESVLTLLRRGSMNEAEARVALRYAALEPDAVERILSLVSMPLTPEQAASGWARNLVDTSRVESIAASWGVDAEDAAVLMGLAGEPPPLEAVIMAWRRGILTESDVDRAIVQGPIRNEWIPAIKALQLQPLTPQDAASAVTQGHLTLEEGEARAALFGVSPEDFGIIVANSGLPPGLEFASEAFNRGILTEDEWTRMFLESRIKNIYLPLMRQMRVRLIPTETVRLMYRLGVYPRDAAVATLQGHGYTAVDAEAQLALEDVRAREGTKDLTRGQILQLVEEEIITPDQGGAMLGSIGFDNTEVSWLLSLVEIDKVRKFVNALVTRVKSGFIAGNIDADRAAELIDEAGVGAAARDRYLALWALEREALSSSLTTAQIQTALKRGYIDEQGALDRFKGRGFTDADADILVRLASPA